MQFANFNNLQIFLKKNTFIYPLPYDDSALYLSYLKKFIEGNSIQGDEFLYNRTGQITAAGNSLIFFIWGNLGKLLNMNLSQTYFFMICLSCVFLFLSIWYFTKGLKLKSFNRIIITLFTCYVVVGFDLGRPSPTQQSLWIVVLALAILGNNYFYLSMIQIFALNLVLVIVFLSNILYGLFLFILLSLYTAIQIKRRYYYFIAGFAACLILAINGYINKPQSSIDQMERFGLLHSRLPSGFKPSASIILCILLLLWAQSRNKKSSYSFLIVINSSLLLALNSQIITNKLFEVESHYKTLTYIIVFASLISVVSGLNEIITSKFDLVLIIALLVSVTSNISKDNFELEFKNSQTENVIEFINGVEFKDKVIFFKNGADIEDLNYIALNSHSFYYWLPISVYANITNQELVERFACSINSSNTNQFDEIKSLVYAHRFSNASQLYPKWNSILKLFGKKEWDYTYEVEVTRRDWITIKSASSECVKLKFKYKIDYLLDYSKLEAEKIIQ
jgi:hypothetical protein